MIKLISIILMICGRSVQSASIFNETEELDLTTMMMMAMNESNETAVPELEVSQPVQRILREIFRSYEPYCWRHSYGRGVGRTLHMCPEHSPDLDGFLCYPNCRDGYNGVGPVCWQKCDNLTAFAFACFDVRQSLRSCPWYDKCGVFKRSCTLCPENYNNFGCLCGRFHLRDSYGRGIGIPMICSDSYEQDGALCYDKCEEKYNGVGPVCWQYCPATQPVPCFAGCSTTKADCRNAVISMIQSVVGASLTLLNVIVGLPIVDLTTLDILSNAAKGDWILVAKDMSRLAVQFADRILPDLAKKFLPWPFDKIQSATRNASLMITATAMKDKKSLLPFLKLFRLDSINLAFNHGKCDLPDQFETIFD